MKVRTVAKAVTEAESRLRHKYILGTVAVGKKGLHVYQKAAPGRMRTLRRDETLSKETR